MPGNKNKSKKNQKKAVVSKDSKVKELKEEEDWLIYYNQPLDYTNFDDSDDEDEVEYDDLWSIREDFFGYDSDNDESIPTDPNEFNVTMQSPSHDSDDDKNNTGYKLAEKYVNVRSR
jgi:hypothetical protein